MVAYQPVRIQRAYLLAEASRPRKTNFRFQISDFRLQACSHAPGRASIGPIGPIRPMVLSPPHAECPVPPFAFPQFRFSAFPLFRVPGSGFQVPGSWFRVPGSWFRIPGSRFLVPGSWFRIPGSWFLVPGSGFQVPNTRFRFCLFPATAFGAAAVCVSAWWLRGP
jgi:hypothetical protein